MKWMKGGLGAGLLLALMAPGWAQTKIQLSGQSRDADFSVFAMTKPARLVSSLPGSCVSGEVVALSSGTTAGLYLCVAGSWSAVVVHAHSLTDLTGITGKHGAGSLLQSFGGGASPEGYCVEFDQNGGLRASSGPCTPGGLPNASSNFTSQTSVAVVHSRGTRNVVVNCFDAAHEWFLPDRVSAYDDNTVIAYFGQSQSGSCSVNTGTGGSGSGAVASVFGRTGPVLAMAGDYDFSLLTGRATLMQGGTNQTGWTAGRCVQVSADGVKLESAEAGCGTSGVTSVFGRSGAVTAQPGDYQFSDLSGMASVAQGGTGGGTASAARQNLLPAYAGNEGRCLTLNAAGTDAEWTECAGGSSTGQVAGTGLQGTGSAGDPFRVNPATVPTFLSAAGVLSFASFSGDGGCEEQIMDFAGAAPGDVVKFGLPNLFPMGVVVGAEYVGAIGQVVLRLCRLAGTATIESAPFTAQIVRSF
jgi:hypothetical protein